MVLEQKELENAKTEARAKIFRRKQYSYDGGKVQFFGNVYALLKR